MSYEFTKDCEIMNCEFNTGERVEENAVQFFPTVMKKSDKAPTLSVNKTGDTLTKEEAKKADQKAKKGGSKKIDTPDPDENTPNEADTPDEGEASKE